MLLVFAVNLSLLLNPEVSSPYSLDVFEGHLYWTSKERGEVWKKDKFGNGEKVKLLTINPWLTQVRIYHQHRCNQSGNDLSLMYVLLLYSNKRDTLEEMHQHLLMSKSLHTWYQWQLETEVGGGIQWLGYLDINWIPQFIFIIVVC